jgi:hypothetical protein
LERRKRGGDGVKIERDLYDEIIDITWATQYKFTMSDGRIGYFNAHYREIGSQDSGDVDMLLENIRDIRWGDGTINNRDDLPTIEQISEALGMEVTA